MAENICGCTGIRKCLICEENKTKESKMQHNLSLGLLNFCVTHVCLRTKKIESGAWRQCSCFSKELNEQEYPFIMTERNGKEHSRPDSFSNLNGRAAAICQEFLGLYDIILKENYVTEEEETVLQTEIYKIPWKLSQSGRRKQDFGPQVNFKRKKLKVGKFTGLPFFLRSVVSRMKALKELADFIPVEVCHLEYSSERGSAIDSHIDDTWLWGERLVTVSLLSSSILTLSHDKHPEVVLQVPMPRCSLLILQGNARHIWKHSIERKDISGIRLAITFRELSKEFITGSKAAIGKEIMDIASNYDGQPLFFE